MNRKIIGIIVVCAGILFLTVFAVQICSSLFSDKIKCETASTVTYNDYVEMTGIALRDEVCVFAEENCDYISYSVEDGNRVAINSEIAFYTTGNLSDADLHAISEINRKIEVLQNTLKSAVQSDAVTLDDNVRDDILFFLGTTENGDYSDSIDKANAVQVSLNRRTIKSNGSAYFETALNDYIDRKADILNKSSASEKFVYAPAAGCFYSGYDGYEYISAKDYLTASASDFDLLISAEPKEPTSNDKTVTDYNYIGKIQNSSTWYFVGAADISLAESFIVGKSVNLSFSVTDESEKTYMATVVNKSIDNNRVIVVFACSQLTEKEFSFRKETCKYIVDSFTGYKVKNNALYAVDGIDGVYVVSAKKVVYKPVNIIYSGNGFSIVVPADENGSRILSEYDEIIVEGKDLFDGKVVDIE